HAAPDRALRTRNGKQASLHVSETETQGASMTRQRMVGLVMMVLLVGASLWSAPPLASGEKDWLSLFNDKLGLSAWDTWLGKPLGEKEAVGLNKDPKKVYSVVEADGKPAIRISGEIFGALTSKKAFENYHLKLEFKWGQKKWPPREKAVRDSGLLYHCVGPQGAQGTFWMRSQECQIQEKDCGDYYSVAGAIVDVEGERKETVTKKGDKIVKSLGPVVYKKGGKKYTVPS